MNQTKLQHYFSQALLWNSGTYIIYKISQTILTFFLYSILSLTEFMTWSIAYSWIFLTVILLSAGFKKSIPRYMPQFVATKKRRSILTLCGISYTCILVAISSTIFIWGRHLAFIFSITYTPKLFSSIALLLFIEGILALLESFYYAQFKNKTFNIIKTLCLLGEITATALFFFLFKQHNTANILVFLFAIKIIFRGIFLISILTRISYTLPFSQHETKHDNNNVTLKTFGKYTGFTWLTTVLKNLTERNALIPFLSLIFGHNITAFCKLAQDCALLVYRITLKTISNNDTALLSYSTTKKERVQNFKKLSQTMIWLTTCVFICALIFIVLSCSFTKKYYLFSPESQASTALSLFIIITIGYVFELALSPFERILEVTYKYKKIILAYIPYISIISISGLYFWYKTPKSMLAVLIAFIIIHASRLLVLLIMARRVDKAYRHIYPWKNLIMTLIVVSSSFLFYSLLTRHLLFL